MNAKKAAALLVCLISLAVVITVTGCSIYLAPSLAPAGKVVNVKTGDPLAGAVVRLHYLNGASAADRPYSDYTATSGSDGSFTFSDVVAGQYELTASKYGYAFIKRIVDVTGEGYSLPNVGGFVPEDEYTLQLFVLWDPSYKDIDAHLTFPSGDVTQYVTPTLASDDFYHQTNPRTGYADIGFFPEDDNRDHVYWDTAHLTGPTLSGFSKPSVQLEVDNVGAADQNAGGPETISIRYFPYDDTTVDNSYTSLGDSDPSGLPSGSYTWVGVMEYYIDSWNNNSSDGTYDPDSYLSETGTSESADAKVYAFYGSEQVGVYTIPTYTQIKTASVLRINMFYQNNGATNPIARPQWFQILPDIRSMGSIKGLDDDTGGIVAVGGRVRKQ